MFLLIALACDTGGAEYPDVCVIPEPDPVSGAVGETVVAVNLHATSLNDTLVTVGSAAAELVSVDREGCDDCDTCSDDAGCALCGDCDACYTECLSCEETVSFVVPALDAGDYDLLIVNARGTSAPGTLTVTTP